MKHFRCVEPIIRFSLRFYPEEIIPLRIPTPSERLTPPLIDVFVSNGRKDSRKINRLEALAIVDEIERLVQNPAYKGRSIGVVSLLGDKQASYIQNLLLKRIGEDRYLHHRIACGDAATFQGKERDVMFLSMVASPGDAQAQVTRLFEQRFNVALSRARDQMYLFRSVSAEDLSNTQDLKLRVINHFTIRCHLERRTLTISLRCAILNSRGMFFVGLSTWDIESHLKSQLVHTESTW